MSNFNIEKLATLLERPDVSKEEIMANIRQIQFTPVTLAVVKNQEKCEVGSAKDLLKDHLAMRHTLKFSPHEANAVGKNSLKNLGRNQKKLCEHASSNTQQSSALKTTEASPESLRRSHRPTNPSNNHSLKEYSLLKRTNRELVNNKMQSPSTAKFSQSSHRASEFLNRMESYQRQRRTRLETQQNESKEAELNECSFYPRTNTFVNVESPRRSSFFEDLKRREIWRKGSLEQHLIEKEKREKAELKECTFRPKINPKKAQALYNTESASTQSRRMRDLESSNEELTFRPKVTLLPKPRKQLQDYLSTNPYERLSKLSKPKSKARTAVHSSLKDPITSALNEFLARQAEHEFSKEVRRQLDLSHSQRAKSSFKALGSAKATASRIERQSAEGEFADRAERQAKERESDEVTSPSVGQRNEEKGSRETKIRLSKKLGGFMETVKTVGGSNTNAL
eukprot:TRINITY_DN7318_c0_g4_i2.p1 TRINITY_DN7318_c0_g4~~TRINITY_DN7318_c0_g4_i2.p1  ORF type:complete len:453 (-),score=108.77 TRINITY_DN7318_c0_g4_i2:91-1449(-)